MASDWKLIYPKTHLSLSKGRNMKCLFGQHVYILLIIILNDNVLLTNIHSRWLDIGQGQFCEANVQAAIFTKTNLVDLPACGFNYKIVIKVLY